jgi:hypothetical protein
MNGAEPAADATSDSVLKQLASKLTRRRIFLRAAPSHFAALWIIICIGATVVCGTAAAEEQAAGIVINLSGETSPVLSPLMEIKSNTTLQVRPGGAITFLHYHLCKFVTVGAGRIRIGIDNYFSEGKVLNEKGGPCPTIYTIQSPGATTGGVLMNSTNPDKLIKVPINTEIIMTSNSGGSIKSVSLKALDNSNSNGTVPVRGGRADLSGSTPTLRVGHAYALTIEFVGQKAAAQIGFVALSADPNNAMLILR